MRIQTLILATPLFMIAAGAGIWMLSSEKAGSRNAVAEYTQKMETHAAQHQKIDELVGLMTGKYGYTNEAALAIVKKLNEPGSGVSAQLTQAGDIEVNVPGEKMSRKILMNKPDLGSGK